ncbi:hypothetical protein [Komagataeibacter xylinus]|uniref:hypothetical protein n=1 Tax=Komagataeibacter xylinus TaxID=28448 RepID=UPI0013EE7164|nr:hypothetical protein [Komagataeibacter xylinus]
MNIFSKSFNERPFFEKRQHLKTFTIFISALFQNHLVHRNNNATGRGEFSPCAQAICAGLHIVACAGSLMRFVMPADGQDAIEGGRQVFGEQRRD